MGFRERYLRKKIDYSHFDRYFDHEGNLAVLTMNVSSAYDILHRFSVKGYETLNDEFVKFITDCAQYVPDDKPLVLNITGTHFTDEEKETIIHAIRDRFLFELAQVNTRDRFRWIKVLFMVLLGAVLAWLMVFIGTKHPELVISSQIAGILFWLCVSYVFDGALIGTGTSINGKIRAAQLSSMAIRFEDTFVDAPFSGEEREKIIDEVSKRLE